MRNTLFLYQLMGCLITVLLFSTCKKEQSANPVPVRNIDFTIYINDPAYYKLNAVNGWIYVTGGVRGIVIWRKSTSEFMAYDRNCTYQSSNTCATISVDASSIIAQDTCCKSKFLLVDGSVQSGPASYPLRRYETAFDGNNALRIYSQ